MVRRHLLSPEVCESAYVGEADQCGEGIWDAILAFGIGPDEFRIALSPFPQFLPVSGVRNGHVYEEGGIRVLHWESCRIFISFVPEVRLEDEVSEILRRINILFVQPFADFSRSCWVH